MGYYSLTAIQKIFYCKTPKHIYELRKIFKVLPNCKVIYLVRNADDNIASLYKRNKDFNFSLKKYINDNLTGITFEHDKRVKRVSYEGLGCIS